LFGKHPDTSIIATLDEQGKLVFPQGETFTPDSSVRINIVGHSEALEQVGARKMNDFLIITAHGFRAIFVHLHIARSTGNANAS
jgi:hypothetical protein